MSTDGMTPILESGYAGYAIVEGMQLLCTSFSASETMNRPVFLPYDMSREQTNRMDVIVGQGTYSGSLSVAFDFTYDCLNLISAANFKRNKEFTVSVFDGNGGSKIEKCKMSSFSVTASMNALVTGTMEFQFTGEDISEAGKESNMFIPETKLLEYWNTGIANSNIETFTFNFTQELTPVILNTKDEFPVYIRSGKIDISVDVTAFPEWFDGDLTIKIYNKQIQISQSLRNSISQSYSGVESPGTYTANFKAYGLTSSNIDNQNVLVIT